ncbi:hypothetical protein HPB52_008892 [Rhipicephalus sanguineus]|uniref:Reverse transcriptase domain-containing protein n=1 Tax=Rhipicephalus sanguineus TaxID=34632 RepID=A0A9D4T085_RHISA|nr:hypothetical protein HPB52_008892 [Rhipicephalus sanguineus]
MSTFKFATWNVRSFRDSYKQREILAFAQAQNIDVLFVQETNFRTPLDVARFRRDFHVDAFFSLTNARACGVGAIFISGRFRQRAHCTFGADGRMLFLDVYISCKRTRFVNIYAPVTRSNTNGFFKDLHQILLEPLPHVLLGDFNCVVDSQRDVRGPGRGGSTYYAKELVKVLKHLKLTDTWLYVHEDLFVPTRTSRTTASRIDRTYVPDFLLPSVVDCEVLTPSSSLAGKSDHSPLVTTLRGTPGPHNGNHGWRLDPSLLEDEHSVEQIRDRLRASLRDAPPMTPQVWDALKETWKAILQEEGRARKTRISAQMNELLRRMRIIRGADTLTACTRNYLDSLEASYARLLRLKTRRPLGAHDQSISPSTLDLDEARGNGGVQIAEVKRPDGSMITDSEEISSAFRNYFRTQFQVSDPEEAVFATQQMRDLCQYLQRPSEEEFSALDGEATMDELQGATQKMPPNSAPGVDGLTAGFYATFMDVLGDALLAVVNALLAKHIKPDSFGAGRIVLLLKDGAPPNELSSWRPITLLNVDYKIVAAILNNRIKLLLPGMISPIQSCAVPNLTLLMFANLMFAYLTATRDVFEYVSSKRLSGAFVSLDQAKAFDRVKHDYLFEVLREFGFPVGFVELVNLLYSGLFCNVVVNGRPTPSFRYTRGIRQGCPLGPTLFILSMEPLLTQLAGNKGIRGFPLTGDDELKVLAYADDVSLFVRDETSFQEFWRTFNRDAEVSGAEINAQKSKALVFGTFPEEAVGHIQTVTTVKVLGIYFSCDRVAEATWQKALERAHLASARIKHLDLTLREKALAAKTCICAFAYYASRIAVIPSRTVTQLNKLIGSLLWDDKPAPVKRHFLQLPENEGGLGLPHIMTMSKILALKTARCLHQATDFFGNGLCDIGAAPIQNS